MQSEAQAKKTKANQNAFLAAYIVAGSIKASAEAVRVGRHTVSKWVQNDTYGFRARFNEAQEDFRESLQDMAVDRIKLQKPGDNPVLLITLLNAHWPEKYKRSGFVADNSAKEIMGEWKRWVKETRKDPKKDEGNDRDNALEEAERILAKKSKQSDGSTDEPAE
ncbi:hypothetical protein CMI37_05560 [Candidatus Pacearchaeota archaeon]|nr:hypothetical protein [Candidatus Pacearchaeota archaeon]|tara:strand:+ start:676 stop:1167 length:492 start_codon:yes stop_codon:yes gene_type:complete